VRNLVDNALRYSPDGARVQVEVALREGRTVLRVQDSGPGLDDAERVRLGERFFRVLGTHASGSGLGWSIVRRIAQAQGATITVGRSEAFGGLDVAVSWPAR
jgi:two-component system sensor histidine kinase QseC